MIQSRSVADVPTERRLPTWEGSVSEIVSSPDLACEFSSNFPGQIARGELGALQLAEITSDMRLLLRTPHETTRTGPDRYVFVLQVHGRGMLSQDGREARLSPGDFAVFDLTRSYQLLFSGPFDVLASR